MQLSDVLLHPSEYDGNSVEAFWRDLLPTDFSVLQVSVLGHLILSDGAGALWLLDSWSGELHNICQSYEQYKLQVQTDPEFFQSVFFADVVAILSDAGLHREPGHVFAPYVSPGLGGSLTPENFSLAPIKAYIATSAAEVKALRGGQ